MILNQAKASRILANACRLITAVRDVSKYQHKAYAMSTYRGRVALVTGASSGIGASIAEDLVKEGLIVVGAARRMEMIQEMAERLKDQPGRLIAKRLDVTNENEIAELFRSIENELGGVDVLVNNAAILHSKPIHLHTVEEIKAAMVVNQLSVILCSREAVNGFIRRKVDDGYIVNINSTTGHFVPYVPHVSMGVYPATKHATVAAGQQMRHDVKDVGIRCRITSISPGLVATDMTTHFQEAGIVPHYLTPQEVSRTVVFALSTPISAEITEITIRPTNEAH